MKQRKDTIEARLKKLGVSEVTIAEVFPNLDLGEIITQDEFHRPAGQIRKEDYEKGYRERAVERMIRDGIPFHSNCNILHDMMKHFIEPVCECGEPMQLSSSSGSGAGMTFTFMCLKCGDELEMVLANKALRYRPGKTPKKEPSREISPEDLIIHEGDFFKIRNAYYAVKNVKRGPDFKMTLDVEAPMKKEG